MAGKLHYQIEATGPLPTALCGWVGSRVTRTESDVTCVLCRTRLDESSAPKPAPVPKGWRPARVGCRTAMELSEDAEEPLEQWPTWQSAVRSYVRTVDDGWGSKSASDPRRFEAIPGATSGAFPGDVAQRNVIRFAEVARALSRAYEQGWVVPCYTSRPRVIYPHDLRAILIGAVVGKPAVERLKAPPSQGGGERTQRIITRSTWEPQELAGAHGITVGMLRAIVTHGGRRVETYLNDRGLVSRLDGQWTEGDELKLTQWDLEGLTEIADALSVDERTVMRWQKTRGLPIEFYAGKWRAERARLVEWIRTEGVRK